MPLFFILSGYLYREEKWNRQKGYQALVCHRISSYLRPYGVLCAVNLLLCLIIFCFKNGITHLLFPQLKTWLFGIFYVYPNVSYMPNCTPLWFLVALFLANLIFYPILNIREKMVQVIVVVLIAVGDAALSMLWHRQLPLVFGAVLIGVCCMYVGHMLQRINWSTINRWALLPLVVIGVITGQRNGRVGVGANNLGANPILFWISAISLSFSAIALLSGVKRPCRLLCWYGRNTIIFMGFNYCFNRLIQALWKRIPYIEAFSCPWYIESFLCVCCISITILIWDRLKQKWPQLSTRVGF